MVGQIKGRLNGNADLAKAIGQWVVVVIAVATLWFKIDSTHTETIAALREQTADLKARVTVIERRLNCLSAEISQGEGSVRATLSNHGARLDALDSQANQ